VHRNFRLSPERIFLYASLLLILLFLALVRPPVPFFALLLVPIALAAIQHEFAGGTLVALVVMLGVALIIALDPDPSRRAIMLRDIWPILVAYLVVGLVVGWLVTRENNRKREIARLYDLEQARTRALMAVGEAGREIAASLDLERTLQLVITQASKTLPMDAGALFILDEQTQEHRVAANYNLAPEDIDRIFFAFQEGVPGWVVKHRQPLMVPDATADPRVHPAVVEQGVKSVLAIPLIAHDKVVGVLNLFDKTETNAFDAEDLRLAQVYADQAAIFIENARLVDELRRAAVELESRVEQRTQELRTTQAQVIRAEKLAAVGRLAASVAHEVNNPLQAIALHLQLITDEGLNDTAGAQMDIVRQELNRISGIVQRLLEFQRPQQGPGERAPRDVTKLLDDVLTLAGKQLQRNNITVQREGAERFEAVLVNSDQLKQVFLNLVLNAAGAMPDGGELSICARRDERAIVIAFDDTGQGLSPEVMPHLFEPFFSTRHDGTGLGLAVSHEIVTAHGGTLEAVNRPGRGASFIVTLPRHQSET
jgi:signal transduction histidine kinase